MLGNRLSGIFDSGKSDILILAGKPHVDAKKFLAVVMLPVFPLDAPRLLQRVGLYGLVGMSARPATANLFREIPRIAIVN
jgi:hypothetical protein